MMKNIITITLICSFSILSFGQKNEHFYFLETDTTWRKEMFVFPINFAPDIEYTGEEDARFPSGWEDQDSPNFWSYAYAWNIKHNKLITRIDLEADLQKYFNGLMRWDKTKVQLLKKEEKNNTTHYTGTVQTKDAFFTQKPMTLNVTIENIFCDEEKKSVILFRFSPKKYDHQVWQKLKEVKLPTSVATCGETKIRKIHNLISACAEYGQFSGAALVAEKGQVIYKNGFGKANMEWNIPNKTNTKHRLASISKQFTALLILQLLADQKIKLDVPITTYLPDYPKTTGNQITIHHLLTHTSGIPNYTSFSNYRDLMKESQRPEEIIERFKNLDLEFTPGEKFAYSNSGYVLLGLIVEKMTGKSYAQVLKEKIFSPLNMNDSGYDDPRKTIPNRAQGYNKIANTFEHANYIDMSTAYAAGALYSTVEDMYLWDQALYTEKLLPKKYMNLLFEKHTPSWGQHYGYGWEIGMIRKGNSKEHIATIGHGGIINGFNTLITRIPSDKSLIVLLNNTGAAPLHDMTRAITGILNDQPYLSPKRSLAFSLLEVIEKDGVTNATSSFKEMKASDEYFLNENEMNLSGYQLLQSGKAKEAAAIFKLNKEAFPNSFNTFDSYGEVLLVLGDTTKAIANYKESIKLNPDNENGIKILNGLGINTSSLITKVPIEHLRLLAGEYKAVDQNRDWKIVIEESDGKLFGNDGGYRYKLNPVGDNKFINPDDGATVVFDTKDRSEISFIIFGKVKFKKVK